MSNSGPLDSKQELLSVLKICKTVQLAAGKHFPLGFMSSRVPHVIHILPTENHHLSFKNPRGPPILINNFKKYSTHIKHNYVQHSYSIHITLYMYTVQYTVNDAEFLKYNTISDYPTRSKCIITISVVVHGNTCPALSLNPTKSNIIHLIACAFRQ